MATYSQDAAVNGISVSETTALATKSFQRGYQACQPCRKRKVKCDLGPVDSPHEPPCARCRREQKDCVFEVTRRKRRSSIAEDVSGEGGEPAHLARKKSARRQTSYDNGQDEIFVESQLEGHELAQAPSQRNGSARYGAKRNNRQHDEFSVNQDSTVDLTQDQEVINEEAALLLGSSVLGNDDALGILAKAASAHNLEKDAPQLRSPSSEGNPRDRTSSLQPAVNDGRRSATDISLRHLKQQSTQATPQLLSIWSRFRIVRAGWLKAEEAVAFVDYYYKNLAPLTPVTHPDLRELEAHPNLINEEPFLTLTVLTVASRYAKVKGPGDDVRSIMIHVKLWEALEKMMTRTFWAQEQSGGGFCGAGANQADRSKLRALGTIESLLLLTDFHPRALHFPPSVNDEDILLDSETPPILNLSNALDSPSPPQSSFTRWTEPAVRSDRMSWSLICFAHTLAYELGVFGTFTQGKSAKHGRLKVEQDQSPDKQRIKQIDRLLYIYMTQASGWYGFPGMYPPDLAARHVNKLHQGFGIDISQTGDYDYPDIIQKFWVEVISINKHCNDVLFFSKQNADCLIESGEYAEGMGELIPVLESWDARLHNANLDNLTKTMLSIEVNYFSKTQAISEVFALLTQLVMYVKSFALQAVLQQAPSKLDRRQNGTEYSTPGSNVSSNFWQLYTDNHVYILGVISASRKILTHVIKDLLPNHHLKHSPVRVVFRIVSAAMFLLKTFALGAKRSEVEKSQRLLEQTVVAFRTSVVDSVHLSLRIADVLEDILDRMKRNFVDYRPETATSPSRSSFSTATAAGNGAPPSNPRHNTRFVRQSRAGSVSGPTYMNEPNSSTTVMPPPPGVYPNFDPSHWPRSYAHPQPQLQHQTPSPTTHLHDPSSIPPNPASNPLSFSPSSTAPSTFHVSPTQQHQQQQHPSADDWMALDLRHLINNPDAFMTGNDSTLFGHPFDPEYDNLEFLERLAPEGQEWIAGAASGGGGGGSGGDYTADAGGASGQNGGMSGMEYLS